MAPPVAETVNDQSNDYASVVSKLSDLNVVVSGTYNTVKTGSDASWLEKIPGPTKKRLEKYGIDLSKGYPKVPDRKDIPTFLDEAYKIRNKEYPYIERGKSADPSKSALFSAAKEVNNLTAHIGTEISSSNPTNWHSDLVHEFQPAGITHLHNDTIPDVGGDTLWASGYAAYDKLSPAFQQFLDGKTAIYRSAHQYLDRENPLSGGKYIEREHPIVRTHPATGWKYLFVNRAMTVRIVGLEPAESELILNFLYDVYEKNLDIQVRWNWRSENGLGTSAIWDNRVANHNAVWDYEGKEPRHGTRVTSLAEVPYFDPQSKSQRQALGLDKE
ncbi:hypothetical protein HF325_002144 [Metschnikowia pulcherrima]|uniref:TauD/TfdA-like domain-containing protein n=1 Tax=Metschnikowia pulcherrima TaxID=27326 RepID=A0A8H7GUR0_9ASCO|nr:hypothetical protein HF325_002144 [Metschnikowia pulcherrima]